MSERGQERGCRGGGGKGRGSNTERERVHTQLNFFLTLAFHRSGVLPYVHIHTHTHTLPYVRSGIGYGSPKPKRGGDEDADHYDSSEEVNWKGLESGKLWGKRKKKTGVWQALEKKNLYIYTHIRIWRYIQVCTMGRRPGVYQALGRDGGWMGGKLRAKFFLSNIQMAPRKFR